MNDITDKEFALISDYIKNKYGIFLTSEKKSLVYSRLRPVLQKYNFANFTEYYDYLLKDTTGEASMVFIDRMTTNHTFFMREVEHFNYFRDVVLPHLEKTVKTKDLRIWCAGCSSGEESYTIEMLIHDYFQGKKDDWDTQILATDVSSSVLAKASKGVYSNEQVKVLYDGWRNKYFEKYDNNNVSVVNSIKKDVIYRKFNLMETVFPFKKKFQVIFCRNVMIYFDNKTRTELVHKFYNASEEGAYLFIGHSESLNNINSEYKYVMPAVYKKI